MIVVVANSTVPSTRRTIPSGVVVFHPTTKHLVALGDNALSRRLRDDFHSGFRYSELDKLRLRQSYEAHAGDLATFIANAPGYYKYGSLHVSVQKWDSDLAVREIRLDDGLTISPSGWEVVALNVEAWND